MNKKSLDRHSFILGAGSLAIQNNTRIHFNTDSDTLEVKNLFNYPRHLYAQEKHIPPQGQFCLIKTSSNWNSSNLALVFSVFLRWMSLQMMSMLATAVVETGKMVSVTKVGIAAPCTQAWGTSWSISIHLPLTRPWVTATGTPAMKPRAMISPPAINDTCCTANVSSCKKPERLMHWFAKSCKKPARLMHCLAGSCRISARFLQQGMHNSISTLLCNNAMKRQ